MKRLIVILSLGLSFSGLLGAQSESDSLAVMKTVALYNQGWYEGDADKMARALHPELIKRVIVRDKSSGQDIVSTISFDTMVHYAEAGTGKNTPRELQNDTVTILDICGQIACVKVEAYDLVDYLQLAKIQGEWKILNVLWMAKATGDRH